MTSPIPRPPYHDAAPDTGEIARIERTRSDRLLSRRRKTPGRVALAGVLWLLTGAIVVSIFGSALYADWSEENLRDYERALAITPFDRVDDVLAELQDVDFSEPAVLCYHDITDGTDDSIYAIDREQFERHMQALELGGFTALSTAEYLAHVRGEQPAPKRSVYITFDDSTGGLFTYADDILDTYEMRATVFAITGRVGRNGSYYLTWEQIRRMAANGRWEFGYHSHDAHQRPPSLTGEPGSMLVNRQDPEQTVAEATSWALRDAVDAREAYRDNGIVPVPVFSYPFSETVRPDDPARPGAVRDPEAARSVFDAMTGTYDATFVNTEYPRVSTTDVITDGPIERIELRDTHSEADLLRLIAAYQPARVAAAEPLASDAVWASSLSTPTDLLLDEQFGTLAAGLDSEGTIAGDYAPQATARWDAYTLNATLQPDALAPEAAAALTLNRGTPAEVTVRANASRIVVSDYTSHGEGTDDARPVVAVPALGGPAQVTVQWQPGHAVVLVDGQLVYNNPDLPLAPARFGVEFTGDPAGPRGATIRGLAVS